MIDEDDVLGFVFGLWALVIVCVIAWGVYGTYQDNRRIKADPFVSSTMVTGKIETLETYRRGAKIVYTAHGVVSSYDDMKTRDEIPYGIWNSLTQGHPVTLEMWTKKSGAREIHLAR